jgi:hypothetical protein
MSLEIGFQQVRFDLSSVVNECAFKDEISTKMQLFDSVANHLFETTGIEQSTRAPICRPDACFPARFPPAD